MIKSLEIIRPFNFPYRLISFTYFFENINSHILNIHHVAGADFIYQQINSYYLFPRNVYYQLLKLQNVEEPHDEKYNWILMKGEFGDDNPISADIKIENEEELPDPIAKHHFDLKRLDVHRIPESGNGIIFTDNQKECFFHFFVCVEVLLQQTNPNPLIKLRYLKSFGNFFQLINALYDSRNNY